MRTTIGPIVAAPDYVKGLSEMVRAYIPEGRRYITLGTDDFGRSDSRTEFRPYFEVDRQAIVQASLRALEDLEAFNEVSE